MKKLLSLIALLVSGCSGGSDDGTLLPGQVDADGPSEPPPTAASPPMAGRKPPAPPPEQGPFPGCPSLREASTTKLPDVASVRTQLVGMYRSCNGGDTGLEVRIDPDSETRLLWYVLDNRFVRVSSGLATTGTIDIGECDGASCSVTWYSNGASDPISPDREMLVWSEPTAMVVKTASGDGASWSEWLRIAD